MEKAINRQKVLLDHLSPPSQSHPSSSAAAAAATLFVSLVFLFLDFVPFILLSLLSKSGLFSFDQPSICSAGDSAAFGDDIVIVAACRTPICKSKRGGFKDTPADDLLAPVLKAVIDRTKVNPSEVGDIVVGTVLAPGALRATECRMAAFYAGFPDTVPIRTVNRQCSSGLQAVADVAAGIKAGFYDIGIGAGLESMTTDGLAAGLQKANPKASQTLSLFSLLRICFTLAA
ncbi:hypothetical protein V6N13_087345 [Hibiscus sabdariffa]|uniref:Thiolase N-terminal domain-containing protein n=1 Tax=Hibiscus sabdariffa TaxID=183260 RepID=A0ABR2FWT0_9ROSI